jgi:hypothetical protein
MGAALALVRRRAGISSMWLCIEQQELGNEKLHQQGESKRVTQQAAIHMCVDSLAASCAHTCRTSVAPAQCAGLIAPVYTC